MPNRPLRSMSLCHCSIPRISIKQEEELKVLIIIIIFFAGLVVGQCAIFILVKLINALFRRIPGGPRTPLDKRGFRYELNPLKFGFEAGLLDSQSWFNAAFAAASYRQSRGNLLDQLTWLFFKLFARSVGKLMPQASRNLNHFLDGTGEPLRQDVDRLLREVSEFRSKVEVHQSAVIAAAVDHFERQGVKDPAVFVFRSAWMKFTCGEYRHLGWFLALGDWEYRLAGRVGILPGEYGGPLTYVVVARVYLRDRYDWDCGPATIIGRFVLPNRIPARLLKSGMAREFTMYGESIIIKRQSTS